MKHRNKYSGRNWPRYFTVVEARIQGKTYRECGELIGVTADRPRVMVFVTHLMITRRREECGEPSLDLDLDPKRMPESWTIGLAWLKKYLHERSVRAVS